MIARGHWQRLKLDAMLNGGTYSPAYNLKGNAKQFTRRYEVSFNRLCNRLRDAGYLVVRVPGPRGGEYSARYYAQKGLEV